MVCIRNADEVWSVSERIRNKRREQGVPMEINKLLPNSPVFNKSKVRKNNNKDLIIVSNLTKSLNMLPILDVIKKLVNKGYDIHLNIIGAGPEERYFKRLVSKEKLDKDIFFLGQLDHEKVLDKISKSYLGFALYTNENSWNIYGDSMKTREYMAYGIPVIMNDIPSTADDVIKYRSGLVVHEINSDEIISFIEKCILDKHYYNALRKNAIIMAQENDKSKILEDLLLNRKK